MIKSCIIYFGSFIISILISYIYSKYSKVDLIEKKAKRRIIKCIWFIGIIILPVLVATFRYNTASDYEMYNKLYQNNEMYGIQYFIRQDGTISELLFWCVLELGRIIFHNLNGVFFISSFITMFFVVASIDRYKNKLCMPYAITIFYLLLYPTSLNIVRQMIAVPICIYAFHYIMERKPLRYCAFIVIASLFHASAIICLAFYLFTNIENEKINKIKNIIIYVLIIMSPILIPVLLEIGKYIPLFDKYYNAYNIVYNAKWGLIIKRLPLLIPIIIYWKKIIKLDKKNELYILMFLSELALYFAAFYNTWGFRLAYYAFGAQIFLIPLIFKCEENKKIRLALKIYFLLYYLGFFIFNFIITGQEGIFPYTSIWG